MSHVKSLFGPRPKVTFAPIDLAGRQISNCSVTMQVKNGEFVRVNPTKAGQFKCWPNGIITRKLDIFTGS